MIPHLIAESESIILMMMADDIWHTADQSQRIHWHFHPYMVHGWSQPQMAGPMIFLPVTSDCRRNMAVHMSVSTALACAALAQVMIIMIMNSLERQPSTATHAICQRCPLDQQAVIHYTLCLQSLKAREGKLRAGH